MMGSVHTQDKHLQRKVAEVTQVLEVIHVTAARVTVIQLSHLALGDEEHHRGAFQMILVVIVNTVIVIVNTMIVIVNTMVVIVYTTSHLALGDEEHHRGAFQIKPLLPHGAFVDVDARHLDGFVFEE